HWPQACSSAAAHDHRDNGKCHCGHPSLASNFKRSWRKTSSRPALTKVNRSQPPKLDIGRLLERIERAFDVHDQPAAVLEQADNHRPTGISIAIMRDGEDDGVGGLRLARQSQAVLLERCRAVGKRIIDLDRHAERLQLTNDIEYLRIANI